MQNIRPYISIDVESTGLEVVKDHHLLSVGMVFDNGEKDMEVEQMPKLHIALKVVEGRNIIGSPYALAMNADLIKFISGFDKELKGEDPKYDCDIQLLHPETAYREIRSFIAGTTLAADEWDKENGERSEKIQVLAKNGSKLDIPMMDNFFYNTTGAKYNWFSELISHRVMDVGAMYIGKYGKVPSLSKINKDIGRAPVTHNALEDAIDNVEALRNIVFGSGIPF